MESLPSAVTDLEYKILEHIRDVDLLSLTSPYLPKTFSKWRSDLYASYSGSQESFIRLIDNTYFPKFLKILSNAYHLSILDNPVLADLPKHDETTSAMVSILSEWSVQIEISVDLIQRSKLYGLYQVDESYEQLFDDLQKEWRNTDSHANIFYKYFLEYFSTITANLKGYVSETLKTYLINNLVKAHGFTLAQIFYAYFSASMPYPIIAIVGTRFIWLFANILTHKIGSKLVEPIEKVNLHLKLNELKSELECLTTDLSVKNNLATELISQCASDPEADLNPLTTLLNELINHEPGEHSEKMTVKESFIAKYSNVHEEDDWVVIDPPPMYSELMDEWIIME